MDYKDIANLPIESLDEGTTIGGYLKELLTALWTEGEGFSGKRPLGNSGWKYEVYVPLVEHGIIYGKLDEDGYLDECNTAEGDVIIEKVIRTIVFGGKS